jgi:uncharacterized protein (DUF427 family)
MKTMNTMKLPGPDHPITIAPHAGRVRVISNGQVVADTTRALALQEASYPAVFYIPRADAEMALLERTPHQTYCPYKEDASYYSIRVGDKLSENAIWSYEQPFPAMADITGHLAFYPDRVDAVEVMTA